MITTTQGSAEDLTSKNTAAKEEFLRRLMHEMKSVLVAYSGGVDSAYLAVIANQELGQNSHAYLGLSPSVSEFQRTEAAKIARDFGIQLHTIETDEMGSAEYRANDAGRCYFCKSELYDKLSTAARDLSAAFVIDGTNADDVRDVRPGRVAAAEAKVRSPLVEAGLGKEEIRQLSRRLGLPTWDKPASPCLSSRLARNVPVTIGRLRQVEDGEDFLRSLGFREFRVRVHGETVRLEIAKAEMSKAFAADTIEMLTARFRSLGFKFVTLDLEGFRSGSLN
ncbi:MAG: ATP-dependent sacrificial sulfur transferase LarE [Pyrinomonadaceae bacterium]